jgi:hypothetical protein
LYKILNTNSFYDWQDDQEQDVSVRYTIFGQVVKNHTFCEIAHRIRTNRIDKFMLLNHGAHNLGNVINIVCDDANINIESRTTIRELIDWFAVNRQPARNFHVIDKHGENKQDIRIINGEKVSPLRCSKSEASDLLQTAIGEKVGELVNNDNKRGYYIVFKHEGNNPQNMYHGYHADYLSNEVKDTIKLMLNSLNN